MTIRRERNSSSPTTFTQRPFESIRSISVCARINRTIGESGRCQSSRFNIVVCDLAKRLSGRDDNRFTLFTLQIEQFTFWCDVSGSWGPLPADVLRTAVPRRGIDAARVIAPQKSGIRSGFSICGCQRCREIPTDALLPVQFASFRVHTRSHTTVDDEAESSPR